MNSLSDLYLGTFRVLYEISIRVLYGMTIILLRMTLMTLCQRESVKCCVIDALYGIIKQKGCLDDVKNYTNW